MDSIKTGILIAKNRKEKNMTQKELADKLHLSDKTISKWERGIGCPDIALINDLAEVLGVNVTEILTGEDLVSDNNMGNMKKIKFYVCYHCGNIITSSNELILSCCGKKLQMLDTRKEQDQKHTINLDFIEDEIFIHVNHPMDKKHFISFIAYVTSDKVILQKLYPEQNAEVRFKRLGHGIIYAFCNQHGLWRKLI